MMKPALVIVGLGNPGKQYELTRHNLGWLALDAIAKDAKAGKYKDQQKFLCTSAEGELGGSTVLLVKPTTFMNRSGECIRKLVDFYKLDAAKQLLVICDDIDLPAGTHRFRMNGGPGTHNGLRSIVESLGEHFPRYRIGLGPKSEETDLAAWVLSRLSTEDRKTIQPAFDEIMPRLRELLATRT